MAVTGFKTEGLAIRYTEIEQIGSPIRRIHIQRSITTPQHRCRLQQPGDTMNRQMPLCQVAFAGNAVSTESYSERERNEGKRPDFKLSKGGKLSAFCEMKSPRDDTIFENPLPGEFAVRKNLPFQRKLGAHICDAAAQLETVNPDHKLPNIVAFVNHAPEIARRDLRATVIGLSARDGKRVFMFGRNFKRRC